MPGNPFEDGRTSEGTRGAGGNPSSSPDRESSTISRDDERDGLPEQTRPAGPATPEPAGGDNTAPATEKDREAPDNIISQNTWEHEVTDSGDYSGDKHQPNRSIEFERTSGYRAGDQKSANKK